MSASPTGEGAAPAPRVAASAEGGAPPINRRQLAKITAVALAIFAGLRLLPTGTNLSHMDFRVDPKAGNAIEFCDPANPQFIPVVAARSPVVVRVRPEAPPQAGVPVSATIRLETASGKPIAPEDLLVTHTRPLHLLIVDPTLADYQHVHPEPAKERGTWRFGFTPRRSGTYRVFADFTPAATARGLYASADLAVTGAPDAPPQVQSEGHRFTLTPAEPPRAGKPIELRFAVARTDGGALTLHPVMGAYAHLVAFDEARSGFAHLHPTESDLSRAPDAKHPTLTFKLTIPRPGRYVVWAQVNLGGERDTFVPFELAVR